MFCILGFMFMLINIVICGYIVTQISDVSKSSLRTPPPPPPNRLLNNARGNTRHVRSTPNGPDVHEKENVRHDYLPPPPPPPPSTSTDRSGSSSVSGHTYKARLPDGSYVQRKVPNRNEVGFVTNMLAVLENWPRPSWKIGEPPIIPGDNVRCLRRIKPETEVIAFMHIAKAGGSAFGKDLGKAKIETPNCDFVSNGLYAPPGNTVKQNADRMFNIIDKAFDHRAGTFGGLIKGKRYEDQTCSKHIPCIRQTNIHFDNSVFTTLSEKSEDRGWRLAPVTVIRDPISRIHSHFFYIKSQAWSKDFKCGQLPSVAECLKSPEGVEELQTVFRDGQAAALWFAGMHTGNWIKRLTPQETDRMIRDFVENPEESLRKAVEAFFDYLWVGIRGNEYTQSKELLQHQARFGSIMESHVNKNKAKRIPLSEDDKVTLKRLIPVDMAFFEYVQAVHKLRYEVYQEMLEDPDGYSSWCDDPENWDFSWERIPLWFNGKRII